MNRTLLILAGSLIVAGIAVFYVYVETYTQEETGGVPVAVVVAAADIPFGQPMQASWLTVEELPSSYVEDRHLRATELRRLIGVRLAQSVRAGEAVLRTDLSSLSDQRRTLSTTIPEGMRAVGLDVRPEQSFSGLLRPGDRVDVVLVVGDMRHPEQGRSVVVAQNVLVLSFGQRMNRQARNSDEARARSGGHSAHVSLQCDLDTAQRLTLARQQGQMKILLRNANDGSRVEAPPDIREAFLRDRARRASWLRRFALAEQPELAPPAVELPPAAGE